MKSRAGIVALLATTALTVVRAQYDSFFFSTNATDWDCPGLPFACQYPYACSHDSTVNKYYCCIPGSSSDVCWTGFTTCSGVNDTTPGSNQLGCDGFCCLEGREECTQRDGQFNICWATAANPLANVTDARMNRTYSSLASASPAATELSFHLDQVTSTTSATSSTTTSSTSSSATGSETSAGSKHSKDGLSGGAVAGIVIGAIAGVLLVLGAGYFFWRNSHGQSKTTVPNQEPYRQQALPHEFYGSDAKQEQQQFQQPKTHQYYQPQHVPQEMDAGVHNRTELESVTSGGRPPAHELPGGGTI